MPNILMTAADGASFPDPPDPVEVICGYAGLPGGLGDGPTRIWDAADWARARASASYVLPIVVPGRGWDATQAAVATRAAVLALGAPAGTLVMLDREEGREDLTAEWCDTFRQTLGTFARPSDPGWYRCVGYTSGSAMSTFAGWTFRLLANPTGTPPTTVEELDGCSGVQWLWAPGYDLSALDPAVAPYLWSTSTAPAGPPAPDPVPPVPKLEVPLMSIPFVARCVQLPVSHRWTKAFPPGSCWLVGPAGVSYIATRESLVGLLDRCEQGTGTDLSARCVSLDARTLAGLARPR